MFTFGQIQEIVSRCKFRDWQILVREDSNDPPEHRSTFAPAGRPYLQLKWKAPNNDDLHGPLEAQISRKWWLSYHMCENEIVRTAYMAVRNAVEHEMQEQFTYLDARIFDPHVDYTRLAAAMKQGIIGQNNRDDVP